MCCNVRRCHQSVAFCPHANLAQIGAPSSEYFHPGRCWACGVLKQQHPLKFRCANVLGWMTVSMQNNAFVHALAYPSQLHFSSSTQVDRRAILCFYVAWFLAAFEITSDPRALPAVLASLVEVAVSLAFGRLSIRLLGLAEISGRKDPNFTLQDAWLNISQDLWHISRQKHWPSRYQSSGRPPKANKS